MRRPYITPCRYESTGPCLAKLFLNICPATDTLDADCNSVDRPARSSPPGCYGQEPILWTNSLDTNAIVNSETSSFGWSLSQSAKTNKKLYVRKSPMHRRRNIAK